LPGPAGLTPVKNIEEWSDSFSLSSNGMFADGVLQS
jgi:hypothetical protein